MQVSMIGHNNPPTDHDMIRDLMKEKNAKALSRAEALVAAADRVPEDIDKDMSEKITDLEKQITVCWNALEGGRKVEKAPYWDMGKVVDEFFGGTLETLAAAKKRVKAIQTKFLIAEEEKERLRRSELARQQKEAADKLVADAAALEDQGKKSQADAVMEKAAAADHDAAFFTEASVQKGATVAASTGEMTGARSSLRYVWTGEILDRNALELEALRPYLPNDALQKALNQYVKNGGRAMKGAKIWEKPDTMTR